MPLIDLSSLSIMILPIAIVSYFYYLWTGDYADVIWATLRMIGQLLVIGFVLTYLFSTTHWFFGVLIILFMIIVASWIVMRTTENRNMTHYLEIAFVIFTIGTSNLLLVLYAVIELEPLYQPTYIIPIAGMIYANAMIVLSLFIERLESELKSFDFLKARSIAFKAAMIPQINTFLAVGLVSLPGMMTGQILSGVDPLIAVRYQIVVMAMIFGSAGMSIILYTLIKAKKASL